MTPAEWESLCDGCGRCCLLKLLDEDTGEVFYTDIVCRLYDEDTCRCRNYAGRGGVVDDCILLTPEKVRTIAWLPPSCAYRLVAEGRDLRPWHPLVSGSPETVHTAGVSTKGRTAGREGGFTVEQLQRRIRRWPAAMPREKKSGS
jgi:uncharacterized cysteine cluster protein YcgN (CxxCxxCC family)